jgi:hypothetical protein
MRLTLLTLGLAAAVSVLGCGESDDESTGGGGAAGSGASAGSGGSGGAGGDAGTGGSAGTGGVTGTGGSGGMVVRQGFESCSADAPGDACKCDPFAADSCDPGDTCAVWLRDGFPEAEVIALDGSDGRTATECLGPDQLTANPVGLPCSRVGDGQGFFTSTCDQNGVCVNGECRRICNAATGDSVCPGQSDVCDFRFGDTDYGACLGP